MGPTGESVTGGPGRYVRKVSGCGNLSPWGPLSIRGETGVCVCVGGGGSFTGDFGE